MDSIAEVFAGLVELVVRLLYSIVRLFIWVIGFILSQTWLVNHFHAIRQFGWWLAVAMSAYLLFGILRAMVPFLATPALTPAFQWQTVILALVLLFVGIALRELQKSNYVTDDPAEPAPVSPQTTPTDGPVQTQPTVHSAGLVAGIVALVLVVAVISAIASERHEATLAEKLCAQADARMSEGVEQAVRDGAGLLDRVFGTQTADAIPCTDD